MRHSLLPDAFLSTTLSQLTKLSPLYEGVRTPGNSQFHQPTFHLGLEDASEALKRGPTDALPPMSILAHTVPISGQSVRLPLSNDPSPSLVSARIPHPQEEAA